MSGPSQTKPPCRKCGEALGRSYVYSADGFMYHHECFPASPSATRIAQLETELAEARAQSIGDWSTQRENDALTIKYYELNAERDRLAAALSEIANGCEGRVDRDSLPCRIARASLQPGEKGE